MSRCHDLALFPATPPKQLLCPLDGMVLRDAVQATSCGHVFGMRCILDYLVDADDCPVCHAELDCGLLAPIQHVRDGVQATLCRCPEEICTWVGPLSALQSHVGSRECAVVRVACPFCHDVFVEGPEFEDHKPECPEVPAVCHRCEADMPRREFAAHEAVCDAVPRAKPRLSLLRASEEPAGSSPAPADDPPVEEEPARTPSAPEKEGAEDTAAVDSTASPQPVPQPAGSASEVTAERRPASRSVRSSHGGVPSPAPTVADDHPSFGLPPVRLTHGSLHDTSGPIASGGSRHRAVSEDPDAMLRSITSASRSEAPSPQLGAQRAASAPAPAPAPALAAEEGTDPSPRAPTPPAKAPPVHPSPAVKTAEKPPRAPTPPALPRSPSPVQLATAACPYASLGCDATHSAPAGTDPMAQAAVMARHLELVTKSLFTMKTKHDALELQVESLKNIEMRRARGHESVNLSRQSVGGHNTSRSRVGNTSTSTSMRANNTSTGFGTASRFGGGSGGASVRNTTHRNPAGVSATNSGASSLRSTTAGPASGGNGGSNTPRGTATSASSAEEKRAASPTATSARTRSKKVAELTTATATVDGAGAVKRTGSAKPGRASGSAGGSGTASPRGEAVVPPPVGRKVHVAPVQAWKAPPPSGDQQQPEPAGTGRAVAGAPSETKLKKTSAAAKSAAKELLHLRAVASANAGSVVPGQAGAGHGGGGGGIAYKDLVSVSPGKQRQHPSSADGASRPHRVGPLSPMREPPRISQDDEPSDL